MSLINRAKNILISPSSEWQSIKSESTSLSSLLTSYILPLALASAAASFIGQAFIGGSIFGMRIGGTISYGLYSGVLVLASSIIGFYVTTYIVDMLAPNFGSEKNLEKSGQLIAYAYTPALVGGLLSILPSLAAIGGLVSLYSLYLIFLGLPVLKNTPEDKRIGYIIVTILVLIVIYAVIGAVLAQILMPLFGVSVFNSFSLPG